MCESIPILSHPDSATCERAARALSDGRIIGFRTETVFGVGVRADSPEAVERLRVWKGRRETQPFQWLIAAPQDALRWVKVGSAALSIMQHCWPGPLTLILPVLNKNETIGLRCPDTPLLREVIARLGVPVAATSANRSGESPANTAKTLAAMGGLALVMDSGSGASGEAGEGKEKDRADAPSSIGQASTVARLMEYDNARPPDIEILRPGAFTRDDLLSAAARR